MNTEQRIQKLEARVLQLEQLLESQGISTSWVSLPQAALAIGINRQRLVQEIQKARLNPKQSDFKEGVHFRHIGKAGAARPTWQINVNEFQKVLSIPIEKRRGA